MQRLLAAARLALVLGLSVFLVACGQFQVLKARNRCQARLIDGTIPPGTDCTEGTGDEELAIKLRRAEDRLSNTGKTRSESRFPDMTQTMFSGTYHLW